MPVHVTQPGGSSGGAVASAILCCTDGSVTGEGIYTTVAEAYAAAQATKGSVNLELLGDLVSITAAVDLDKRINVIGVPLTGSKVAVAISGSGALNNAGNVTLANIGIVSTKTESVAVAVPNDSNINLQNFSLIAEGAGAGIQASDGATVYMSQGSALLADTGKAFKAGMGATVNVVVNDTSSIAASALGDTGTSTTTIKTTSTQASVGEQEIDGAYSVTSESAGITQKSIASATGGEAGGVATLALTAADLEQATLELTGTIAYHVIATWPTDTALRGRMWLVRNGSSLVTKWIKLGTEALLWLPPSASRLVTLDSDGVLRSADGCGDRVEWTTEVSDLTEGMINLFLLPADWAVSGPIETIAELPESETPATWRTAVGVDGEEPLWLDLDSNELEPRGFLSTDWGEGHPGYYLSSGNKQVVRALEIDPGDPITGLVVEYRWSASRGPVGPRGPSGATGATGGTGATGAAGASSGDTLWSPPQSGMGSGSRVGTIAVAAEGDYTLGARYTVIAERTIRGVRFYWPGGVGAKVVRASIFDELNTTIATVDTAVNAAALVEAEFASPLAISGALVGSTLTVGLYVTDGVRVLKYTAGSLVPTLPVLVSKNTYLLEYTLFGFGDSCPANASSSSVAVDLLFDD
jgi:hypothetical protein